MSLQILSVEDGNLSWLCNHVIDSLLFTNYQNYLFEDPIPIPDISAKGRVSTGNGSSSLLKSSVAMRTSSGPNIASNRRKKQQIYRVSTLDSESYERMVYISNQLDNCNHFFYWFVSTVNDHRFIEQLKDDILIRIGNIIKTYSLRINQSQSINGLNGSNVNGSQSPAIFEPFALIILKLKVLGRFLALLCFQNQFIRDDNELRHDIKPVAGLNRNILPSARYPWHDLLIDAWKHGYLVYAVPTVVSFLHMTRFIEKSSSSKHLYDDCIDLLLSVPQSPDYRSKASSLSSNQLFVVTEIQSLANIFNPSRTYVSKSILPKQNVELKEGLIDYSNDCFIGKFTQWFLLSNASITTKDDHISPKDTRSDVIQSKRKDSGSEGAISVASRETKALTQTTTPTRRNASSGSLPNGSILSLSPISRYEMQLPSPKTSLGDRMDKYER